MMRLTQSAITNPLQGQRACTPFPSWQPQHTRRPHPQHDTAQRHCAPSIAPSSLSNPTRPLSTRPLQLLQAQPASQVATQAQHTPVTLLSGVSNNAKLSFLHRILNHLQAGQRVGVLLTSSIKPLQDLLSVSGPMAASGPLVTLPNGSVLGSAADHEHLSHMRTLAEQGLLRYIVVEDGPCESPLLTAATFDLQFETLGQGMALTTLVTALDANSVVEDLLSSQSLAEAGLVDEEDEDVGGVFGMTDQEEEDLRAGGGEEGEEGGYEDDRTLADVLVEQVEYAQILVLDGLNDMDPEAASQVKTLLQHLNRKAQVHDLKSSEMITYQLEAPLPVDLEQLQLQGPGWAVDVNAWGRAGVATPPLAAHGVSTWLYGASRPFHPQRLLDIALVGTWPGVARSKGYVWLATRNDYVGLWQSAGGSWQCEPSGRWVGCVPESERPPDTDTSSWHPKYQDRSTQLVWTGVHMQEDQLRFMLDACLLTDDEMAGGPELWATFPDPLPEWTREDDNHNHKHDHDHDNHEHTH